MNSFDVAIASVATLAAVASAYAALSLNGLEKEKREFEERQTAIRVLSDWSKSFTMAGESCAIFLAQYDHQEFVEAASTRKFPMKANQDGAIARCFAGFAAPLDTNRDRILNDAARSYLAREVVGQLNAYEGLSLYWTELGDKAKAIICEQAKVKAKSAYRDLEKIAAGTDWWNYPRFVNFMAACK